MRKEKSERDSETQTREHANKTERKREQGLGRERGD